VDLDPGDPAREVRHEPREPAQAATPEEVGEAVDQQRVKAGVTRDDLPGGPGRRVAVEHAGNVFADAGEHV
jgi:hypothetical protein